VVTFPDARQQTRGSVWIEQEIAIAAFLAQSTNRDIKVAAYIHESVSREGIRDLLHLNPQPFRTDEEVLKHLRAALGSWVGLSSSKIELTAKFAEAAISGGNATNFKMFLEMARERLVERWDSHESGGLGTTLDHDTWFAKRAEIYRNEFIPALDSTVDLGLKVIKYDASLEWAGFTVNVLLESFEACRRMEQLSPRLIAVRTEAVPFARPAYDVYVGVRTIATYAVMRERFRFLKEVLPKYVRCFTMDSTSQVYVPLLFWPFSGVPGLPDMRQGRNETLWNEHIHKAWGQYFGTLEKFLAAAFQLEFILEFNSYIFEGVQIPEVEKLRQTFGNKDFIYLPDFWANRLDPVVPIAEHFYDTLVAGSGFPSEFSIEKPAIELVFKDKDVQDRLLFLGGFLAHLKSWQAQAMMEQRRHPFMFDWEGRLKAIVNKYIQDKQAH
jgi:hypothetical protein